MNEFMHTLTAYHLHFSYMKRNNPLREELLKYIKNDEKPNIIISELFEEFISLTNNHEYPLLINNGRVILLDKIEDIYNFDEYKKRMFIIPKAGKTNIPIQMVNLKQTDKIYNFGANWASTYPNNIFIYDINGEYYLVCHRNGGSGCKTVLCAVLNQLQKQKGIKVEMNWMPPTIDESSTNYNIDKISLIYEENKSSDITDEPNRKTKKIQIKELTLSLNQGRFSKISSILNNFKLKEISKDEALEQIKIDVDDDSYNNASLIVKIGKSNKKVSWDDFEGLLDSFDITEKVRGLKEKKFIDELKKCSDEFLLSLLDGERL